jgi:hypothetical protein
VGLSWREMRIGKHSRMKSFHYEVWFADGAVERANTLKAAQEAIRERPSALPARVWLRSEKLVGTARLVEIVTKTAGAI